MIVVIAARLGKGNHPNMNTSDYVRRNQSFINLFNRAAAVAVVAVFVFTQASLAASSERSAESLKPFPPIPVAFVVSEGAVVIDFCGPWEVFRDVMLPGGEQPFRLYTVSDKTKPIRAGGGMKIVPDYTFANAPAPKVIVIPAQSEPSKAMLDWIRQMTKNTDVTMSVCTGAFILAKTGLLDGKSATTFHGAFGSFAMRFPNIELKRGARFVENGNVATAGGLSSGIDLALRVVERYYGQEIAEKTAYNMEYQGKGWMNAESNQTYATLPVSTAEHPVCAVCGMDVDPKTSPQSVFNGVTYYFCSQDDKKTFDTAPGQFVSADKQPVASDR